MSDRDIIESINKITGGHKNDIVTYINARVISVNESERICSCIAIDGHTEYDLPVVKLMPDIEDGILVIPEEDSTVKVIFSQNIEPFVAQFSNIKKYVIFASEKIELQGSEFGGMVKVEELTNKLNNIENQLNQILLTLKSIVVPTPTPYPFAPLFLGVQNLQPTEIGDLENKAVQHGTN